MRIITVAHTKGGVGKSTISWNLSITLGCCDVIDLDFQQTILLSSKIRKEQEDLKPLEVHTASSIEDLHEHIDKIQSDIIIDVGGYDSQINREAMKLSDIIIVPISISLTEVFGFKTFEQILSDECIDTSRVRLLINNIHHRVSNFDEIKGAIGDDYMFFDTTIKQRSDFKTSLSLGLGVSESGNYPKSREELISLVQEINSL